MDQICTHLDALIPDHLKLSLHQAFWRHRRGCARCDGRHSRSSWAWQNADCPLEAAELVTFPKPAVVDELEELEKPEFEETRGSGPPKPKVDKRLRSEETIAETLKQGFVLREYFLDDDFDAGDDHGKKPIKSFVKDYSKVVYDPVEDIMEDFEEIQSMIRTI